MPEPVWYYMKGQERVGPVGVEQVREAFARGELAGTALVWAEGMPQWIAAANVPALTQSPSAPQAPIAGEPSAAAPATPIGYYSTSGMPPRAEIHLRGHARPSGDVGDWPLDDHRISLFSETVRVRKLVTNAAGLYRALLFLSIIAAAILLLGFGIGMLGGRRTRTPWDSLMAIPAITGLAFCILYYFSWRATLRAHRWAPLTMFCIFLLLAFINIAGCISGSISIDPGAMLGNFFGLIISAAFAFVSWRSYTNIPKYLSQPAWCQELIVKAGL